MPPFQFVYDGQNLLVETNTSNAAQAVYTVEPLLYGNLVSQRQLVGASWSQIYYHFDALGSTDRLSDASQVVTDSYTYFGFGELKTSSGTTTNLFTWVGRLGYRREIETGEYNLRARQYLPDAARFKSEDPLGVDWSENLYRYVDNDSVNSIDPTGAYRTSEECESQRQRMRDSQTFLQNELNRSSGAATAAWNELDQINRRIADLESKRAQAAQASWAARLRLETATADLEALKAEQQEFKNFLVSTDRGGDLSVKMNRDRSYWRRELQRRAAVALRYRGNWALRTAVDEAREMLQQLDAGFRNLARERAAASDAVRNLESLIAKAQGRVRSLEKEEVTPESGCELESQLAQLRQAAKQKKKDLQELKRLTAVDKQSYDKLTAALRQMDCSRPEPQQCGQCTTSPRMCSQEFEIPPGFYELVAFKLSTFGRGTFVPDRIRVDYPCDRADELQFLTALEARQRLFDTGLQNIQSDVAITAAIAKETALFVLPGGSAIEAAEVAANLKQEGFTTGNCLQAGLILIHVSGKIVNAPDDLGLPAGGPARKPKPDVCAPNRPSGYTRMQDYIPELGKPSLPATTRLTQQQVFALQENLQAVVNQSIPGYRQLIASGRPRAEVLKGLQNQMNLLRWRFIDQVPGGREAIQGILREFPEITFPH